VPTGRLVRGRFRWHCAGVEETPATVGQATHVAGEGEAARDDAQSGAFDEE
jgi:hypothetical protein